MSKKNKHRNGKQMNMPKTEKELLAQLEAIGITHFWGIGVTEPDSEGKRGLEHYFRGDPEIMAEALCYIADNDESIDRVLRAVMFQGFDIEHDKLDKRIRSYQNCKAQCDDCIHSRPCDPEESGGYDNNCPLSALFKGVEAMTSRFKEHVKKYGLDAASMEFNLQNFEAIKNLFFQFLKLKHDERTDIKWADKGSDFLCPMFFPTEMSSVMSFPVDEEPSAELEKNGNRACAA